MKNLVSTEGEHKRADACDDNSDTERAGKFDYEVEK